MGINPGHVAAAAVSPNENHSPTQGGLDGGQNVKSIQPKLPVPQLRRGDAMRVTPLLRLPGTSAPSNRDPLPPRQMVTVSNQFRRGSDAVAMVQKPA